MQIYFISENCSKFSGRVFLCYFLFSLCPLVPYNNRHGCSKQVIGPAGKTCTTHYQWCAFRLTIITKILEQRTHSGQTVENNKSKLCRALDYCQYSWRLYCIERKKSYFEMLFVDDNKQVIKSHKLSFSFFFCCNNYKPF